MSVAQKINILIYLLILLREINKKKNKDKFKEKKKGLLDKAVEIIDHKFKLTFLDNFH